MADKAGPGRGTLVALDMTQRGQGTGAVRELLRRGGRFLPVNLRGPWLVLAPAGDAGDRAWCAGNPVLAPVDVLDAGARRSLGDQALRSAWCIADALGADAEAMNFGRIHFGFILRWMVSLLSIEGAIRSSIARTGAARCVLVSERRDRARWLAHGLRTTGVTVRAIGATLGADWGRPRPRRAQAWLVPGNLPRSEVLLVAESLPMAQMFDAVLDAFPPSLRDTALMIQYGTGISSPPRSAGQRVALRPQGGARRKAGLGGPPASVARLSDPNWLSRTACGLSPSLAASLPSLARRMVTELVPDTLALAGHIRELLEVVRPRVMVVGNDRYWTGQLFVALAEEMGIQTVCVQDGVSADVPSWSFSTARHMLAMTEEWPQQVQPAGWRSVAVVGQPRYDTLQQRFHQVRMAGAPEGIPSSPRVLLALQEIHDTEYARVVIDELLKVSGSIIKVRPHPATREGMADFQGSPRVFLSDGDDGVVDLAWADLVITEYSTIGAEAMALGVPVLSVVLSGNPPVLDFGNEGAVRTVFRREDIAPAAQALLERPIARSGSPPCPANDPRFIGVMDGHAGARVARYLEDLLNASS